MNLKMKKGEMKMYVLTISHEVFKKPKIESFHNSFIEANLALNSKLSRKLDGYVYTISEFKPVKQVKDTGRGSAELVTDGNGVVLV